MLKKFQKNKILLIWGQEKKVKKRLLLLKWKTIYCKCKLLMVAIVTRLNVQVIVIGDLVPSSVLIQALSIAGF